MVSRIPVPSLNTGADVQGAKGCLTIDLSALGRNYDRLAATVAPARAAAVIKANAYGFGAGRVAKILYCKGFRHFFVAQFPEAVELQPIIPRDAQIFALNGLQPGQEIACADSGIVPVLNSIDQWRQWSATAHSFGRKLWAVLQFDTGMSRLGFPPDERPALAQALKTDDTIEILFIMSHLASADETDSDQNSEQLAEMRRIAVEFAGFDMSFANSGGVFLGNSYHGVLALPCIALYGGPPTVGVSNPMEPVVSLDVAVVQVRTVPAGTKVGYGGVHVTRQDARLPTIAPGYADGLPRSLSDRGAVYYEGVLLPIVGRVSMDSITVDISTLPKGTLALGSVAEVLGPNQPLEDMARDGGTIAYEIRTRLWPRYQRRYH